MRGIEWNVEDAFRENVIVFVQYSGVAYILKAYEFLEKIINDSDI
jgi:hypothetical protein